ncbi:glutaredoxin family protein [uncultured Zoogloea sp.]|uniref:glutaredoxin family protein n=1 Tax=uncultured Zoogloea sp. TaxID=160237 RepID=UPI00262C5D38|nr:glutaredoxin family protein [uncultured Zoogloea sp.]
MSADRQLIVLSRMWCHLCHDLLAALAPLQDELGFSVRVVDLDTDAPELEEVWGEKVPVLLDGDVELCHYFLDETAVRAHFRRIG